MFPKEQFLRNSFKFLCNPLFYAKSYLNHKIDDKLNYLPKITKCTKTCTYAIIFLYLIGLVQFSININNNNYDVKSIRNVGIL